MELSRVERLILSNQFKILEILDKDNKDFYLTSQNILANGYEILYSHFLQGIYSEEETVSVEESKFVFNILDMFRQITYALGRIEDKSGIHESCLKFMGFDGNDEGKYYGFAKYFCTEFNGTNYPEIGTGDDDFNSHSPTLDTYQRMVEVWLSCKDKYELTKDDLINIATAFVHPANRK